MKFLKRNTPTKVNEMNGTVTTGGVTDTADETIDLSDHSGLSQEEIDERHAELDRVEKKLEALQLRQEVLLDELDLRRETLEQELDLRHEGEDVASEDDDELDESVLFLDETLDAFATSPPAKRTDSFSSDFDIDDLEFDERFAAFASSDDKGDHKARRWFDKA